MNGSMANPALDTHQELGEHRHIYNSALGDLPEQHSEPYTHPSALPQGHASPHSRQSPLEVDTSAGGIPLAQTARIDTGTSDASRDLSRKMVQGYWWRRILNMIGQTSEESNQPQSSPAPDLGWPLSPKPGLVSPRPATFTRQDSERRDNLPYPDTNPERKTATERSKKHRAAPVERVPTESDSTIVDEADVAVDNHDSIYDNITFGIDISGEALDELIQLLRVFQTRFKYLLRQTMMDAEEIEVAEDSGVFLPRQLHKWRRRDLIGKHRVLIAAYRASGRTEHPGRDSSQRPSTAALKHVLGSDTHVQKAHLIKLKQGLIGFANGTNIAAMADTGSRENIISASYAKELGLRVKGSPSSFKIGNARKIQSLGTVSLLWAFAENPKESFSILCHVLPRCTYSLILGNGFLKATETMSRFSHRLSKCFFSIINNVSHFGFLGETYQRLEGTIADTHQVLAIPDTGADRNVMSLQYAIDHGLSIKTQPENCGYLQFADGSFDETVGQVETYWTFTSGERIPVTFEILQYCCSDVIIGEDILTEHNVFQEHAGSILSDMAFDNDCYELAPFDFVNSWQRRYERLIEKIAPKKDPPQHQPPTPDPRTEELYRRNMWNRKYDFGASATTCEKELELARRECYKSSQYSSNLPHRDDQSRRSSDGERGSSAPQQRMPVIPSIHTSQSRR